MEETALAPDGTTAHNHPREKQRPPNHASVHYLMTSSPEIPPTGADTGTPASIKANDVAHVVAMDEEPLLMVTFSGDRTGANGRSVHARAR